MLYLLNLYHCYVTMVHGAFSEATCDRQGYEQE